MPDLRELARQGKLTFTWRAVGDKNMCDDCSGRHGEMGYTLQEWESLGLPGTGWSRCQGACRCVLLPDNLLEVETEILEPFEITPVIRGEEAETPLEAARLAINARLLAEFPPGTIVEYEGRTGLVAPGGTKNALLVDVEGLGRIQVFDFTELEIIGGTSGS